MIIHKGRHTDISEDRHDTSRHNIRGVQLLIFITLLLSCKMLVPFVLANDNILCHSHVILPIIQLLIEPPLFSFLCLEKRYYKPYMNIPKIALMFYPF